MSVIVSHGVPALSHALHNEGESHIRAAASWSLGQIGRHTPEHARHVAEANVLPDLLACTMDPAASDDLRAKVCACIHHWQHT